MEDITYRPKTFQGEDWVKQDDSVESSKGSMSEELPAQLTVDRVISLLSDTLSGSLKDNAIKYLEDYKVKKADNINLVEKINSLENELAGYKFAETKETEEDEK